jgi:hypothetical protein
MLDVEGDMSESSNRGLRFRTSVHTSKRGVSEEESMKKKNVPKKTE